MTPDVHALPSHTEFPPRGERDWVTSAELVDESRISLRQLDYWTRTGLLTTMEDHLPGSGYLRRYDAGQLTRAQVLHDLLGAGLTLPVCRLVIDDIAATGHANLGPVTITRTPGDAA